MVAITSTMIICMHYLCYSDHCVHVHVCVLFFVVPHATFGYQYHASTLVRNQFDLSVQDFRDGLTLHNKKPLLCLSFACDGYRAPSSTKHAFDCHIGGTMSSIMLLWSNLFTKFFPVLWASLVIQNGGVQDSWWHLFAFTGCWLIYLSSSYLAYPFILVLTLG